MSWSSQQSRPNRRTFLAAVGAVSASALAACRQGSERAGSPAGTPVR